MSLSHQTIVAHPAAPDMGPAERTAFSECIDAALACAQACIAGADSCLEEPDVADLRAVIRAQQNCASVCVAAAQILSRFGSDFGTVPASILRALSESSTQCREACLEVAPLYLHCRISARACERVLSALTAFAAVS